MLGNNDNPRKEYPNANGHTRATKGVMPVKGQNQYSMVGVVVSILNLFTKVIFGRTEYESVNT